MPDYYYLCVSLLCQASAKILAHLCHLHGTIVPPYWHNCAMQVAQMLQQHGKSS